MLFCSARYIQEPIIHAQSVQAALIGNFESFSNSNPAVTGFNPVDEQPACPTDVGPLAFTVSLLQREHRHYCGRWKEQTIQSELFGKPFVL